MNNHSIKTMSNNISYLCKEVLFDDLEGSDIVLVYPHLNKRLIPKMIEDMKTYFKELSEIITEFDPTIEMKTLVDYISIGVILKHHTSLPLDNLKVLQLMSFLNSLSKSGIFDRIDKQFNLERNQKFSKMFEEQLLTDPIIVELYQTMYLKRMTKIEEMSI